MHTFLNFQLQYYAMHPAHRINPETGKSEVLETLLRKLETDEHQKMKRNIKKGKCPFNGGGNSRAKIEEIYQILDSSFDQYRYDSDFAMDIRETVVDYFQTNKLTMYAPFSYWLRFCMIVGTNVVFEIINMFYCSPWVALVIGISHAGIGLCVMHDACHGAVSSSPWINETIYAYSEVVGMPRRMWTEKHIQSHHTYSNDPTKDTDANSGDPFVRFDIPDRNWFQNNFQGFFCWLFFALYLPSNVFHPTFWTLTAMKEMGLYSLFMKFFFIYRFMIHPVLLTGNIWNGMMVIWIVMVTFSVLVASLFALSHNFLGVYRGDILPGDDWYRHQVITTSSYGGFWASFMTGGLNFQVCHHLFPKVNSMNYWRLQPIIEAICDEYDDVNYCYFPTIFENFKSTITYMGVPKWISKKSPRPYELLAKKNGAKLNKSE